MGEFGEGIENAAGKPVSYNEAESKDLDFKMAGSGSVAEVLRILGTDLKHGLQVSSSKVFTSEELQVWALLKLAGDRERGPEKGIKEPTKSDPLLNPLGLTDTMEGLAQDENFPKRTKLDWLLIEAAGKAARKEKVHHSDFVSRNLWKIMTSEEWEEEQKRDLSREPLMTRFDENYEPPPYGEELNPIEAVSKFLKDGERQYAIGEKAWEEKRKAEKFADASFGIKGTLEEVPVSQEFDLRYKGPDPQNYRGRFVFSQIPRLSFDPDKLAMAIINGEFADPPQKNNGYLPPVYAHYAHYKSDIPVSKTRFILNMGEARDLLERCFEEKGLHAASVDSALYKYKEDIDRLPEQRQKAFQYSIAEQLSKY